MTFTRGSGASYGHGSEISQLATPVLKALLHLKEATVDQVSEYVKSSAQEVARCLAFLDKTGLAKKVDNETYISRTSDKWENAPKLEEAIHTENQRLERGYELLRSLPTTDAVTVNTSSDILTDVYRAIATEGVTTDSVLKIKFSSYSKGEINNALKELKEQRLIHEQEAAGVKMYMPARKAKTKKPERLTDQFPPALWRS